jgi:acyl dehydratase
MEQPREGDTITTDRTFTAEEVRRYADLSGDDQPRHTEPGDDDRLMVQGLLTATLPTKLGSDREVLATRLELDFLEPVYTGERVTCYATYDEVTERDDRYAFTWDVVCETDDGEAVLEATVDGIVWKEA